MDSHYTESHEADLDEPICMMCEGVTGETDMPSMQTVNRGKLIPVRRRPDNGRPQFVHEKCLQFEPRAASQENIWAFASKFKYYTAASGTDGMTPTVQETFPSVDMPREEPATTTDVEQNHSTDGAPLPPKPFSSN